MGVQAPIFTQGQYAVGCATDLVTSLRIDGVDMSIDCSGVDGFSYVFGAWSIQTNLQTPPSTTVSRPNRFVF